MNSFKLYNESIDKIISIFHYNNKGYSSISMIQIVLYSVFFYLKMAALSTSVPISVNSRLKSEPQQNFA